MKVKTRFAKVMVVLFTLTFLIVGCDEDASERVVLPASVSFETQQQNQDDIYWRYIISDKEVDLDTATNWMSFEDTEENGGKGIGTVSNLIQGKTYYFALKGYEDSSCTGVSQIWQGKTSSGYELNDISTMVIF